jgi:hypothetical protein
MAEKGNIRPTFIGTYFNKESVLRLARWAEIISWVLMAAYVIQWGYSQWQSISNSISGGYPIDMNYTLFSIPQLLQGVMLLIILQAVSKVLLILLDIEDNTRRAARN